MRRLPGSLLVTLAIAALVALFFASCEKRSETIESGFTGEAARNRYLAAQWLLEAMGAELHAVGWIGELDELPPTDATLIAPINRTNLSVERSTALLEWARSGGHVVVVTWSLWNDEERTPDPIVDPLGIEQYMWDSSDEARDADVAMVPFPDRSEPLRAEFDPHFFLDAAEDSAPVHWKISDRNGAHLLTVRAGDGWVTTLTDDTMLSNASIGSLDHAELVWRLAHLDGRSGPVWIVWNTSYPGAWTLAWRHGWMVLVSLLVLLALWVWSTSQRFGPIRPDDALERRRLMEHIEAAGRFQLREGNEAVLSTSVRDAILVRLRERHPGWLGLSPAELSGRLAEITGLPRERIARALSYRNVRDRERVAQRIATLEQIRKAL